MGGGNSRRDVFGRVLWLILAAVVSAEIAFVVVKHEQRLQREQTSAETVFGSSPAKFKHETAITLEQLYERALPAIVRVDATARKKGKVFASKELMGTGFIADSNGDIITNYHVVQGSNTVDIVLHNGQRLSARVVGSDPSTDIAVLHTTWDLSSITPLSLGNSSTLVPGEDVAAIGNPLGLDDTLTTGVVSALNRTIEAPNGFAIAHVIQTDAILNHGSSGGPLFDPAGEVVGITSAIQAVNSGIGYAIPINTVRQVVGELLKGKKVTHAYLGVRTFTVDPDLQRVLRLPIASGVLVISEEKKGPAAKGGLRPCARLIRIDGKEYRTGGDIITAINGERVQTTDDLTALVSGLHPGQVARIKIRRGHRYLTVRVKLGVRPASAG